MKKLIALAIFLLAYCSSIAQTDIPLGMRLETQKTWVKFVPKTYIKGHNGNNKKVGTLLITVRSYDVYQVGDDSLNITDDAGQLYILYTDARSTVKRRYLGYYRGNHDYTDHVFTFRGQDFAINPMFDEQTSNQRLQNTVFFNKDNTKCHYFQLDKWSVPVKLELLPVLMNGIEW